MDRTPFICLLAALLLGGCYTIATPDDDDAGDDDAGDDDAGDDDIGDDDAGDDDAGDDDAGDDDAGDDDAGDDDAGDDDAGDGPPITCSPSTASLAVVQGTPASITFSATVDDGGGPTPVNDGSWSVTSGGGTINAAGVYTAPQDHGGTAEVRVWRQGREDSCTVEMTYEAADNQSGNSAVPGAFDTATVLTDAGCASQLVYPLDGSVAPGTFAPPLIQWTGVGSQMHRLTLSSSWTTIEVFLTGDSYQPSDAQWQALTTYDPGTVIDIELASGPWSGSAFSGSVCTTGAITHEVTDFALTGTVVYWAPPFTKRIDFAGGQPTNGSLNFAPATCHGCHSVNLANTQLMAYGPNIPLSTNIVDLSAPATTIASMIGDYGALDPTGQYIVVGGLFGGLTLHNAQTGASLGAVSTQSSATMPTWSPDGTTIAYSVCDAPANALQGVRCDLYKQTWNPATTSFSGETLLVAHSGEETLYYPTFSPDSQWVAYNHGVPTPDPSDPTSTTWTNANPSATLRMVHVTGAPNHILANSNGVGDLTNSWPRWAPDEGDFAWLAWSSKRSYGHQVEGRAQLWVSAIDLDAALSSSGDPAAPPVWLPGQLISEGNHTPTWVLRLN